MTGINARFSEILGGSAPVPPQFGIEGIAPRTFSLQEVVNTAYADLWASQQSITGVEEEVLFSYLGIVADQPANADAIFSDLSGIPGVISANWTITGGDSCGSLPITGRSRVTGRSSLTATQATLMKKKGRSMFPHVMRTKTHGSFGAVLGPSLTGGTTLGLGGPQNTYTAPSPSYIAYLNAPGYSQTNTGFVGSAILPDSGCCITNGCYAYNLYNVTGLRISRYFAVEP